jgi:hypothetical protein
MRRAAEAERMPACPAFLAREHRSGVRIRSIAAASPCRARARALRSRYASRHFLESSGTWRTRAFAVALAAGAAAAHLLCALLFQGAAPGDRGPAGASILFFPLGPLLVCRRLSAFECLPLPLALARLGCVAAGCCRGAAGRAAPIPGGRRAGGAARRSAPADRRRPPGAFLLAFGLLRVVQEPWRSTPEGALATPAAVALAWTLAGALWLTRPATMR